MTDALARLATALADRYTIERELGAGGMATVYLAHDIKHDRKVAVKVLRPELAAALGTERFLNEIKITANLNHPHILPLLDSGTTKEQPSVRPPDRPSAFLYYVMPYLEGESLREKLNQEKQLSIEESIAITKAVASALDYAHRQNVIHRDIKPENILLHDGQPVVADFGISLAVTAAGGARLTETGLSLGTPQYMSPEQATGDREIDGRSDVYSLACVLYEMLAGEPPHTGPTAQAVLAKVVSERAKPLRQKRDRVPWWLEEAVDSALAPTPADRFATAGAFVAAAGTPRSESKTRGSKKPIVAIVVTAIATAVFTAAIVLATVGNDGSRASPDTPVPIERPLTLTGTATTVGLSPDGETVAYSTPSGLVARDVRSGGETLVLGRWQGGLGLPLSDPRWMPDGSGLFFGQVMGEQQFGTMLVPRLGGDPTPIHMATLETGQPVADPHFFPDGKQLLLVRVLEPGEAKPWLRVVLSPDSSYGIETDPSAIRIWDATISPTGEQIAYIGERADRSAFIATVSARGGPSNVVVEGGQDLVKWHELSANLRWPLFRIMKWVAGDRLYYRRHSGRGMDIQVVRIDPSTGRSDGLSNTVVHGLPRGSSFDVAADASRLVYAGGINRAHVHMMRAYGSSGRPRVSDSVVTSGTGWNMYPRISTDGRRIAFVAKTFEASDIFILERGEQELRRLNPLYRWRSINTMEWSPDGEHLLVHAQTDEGDRLLIVSISDPEVEDLGPIPSVTVQIGWSPDGRYVVYGAADASFYNLRELATGETRELLGDVADELIYVFFSPDSRHVAAQDVSTNLIWITPVEGGDARSIGPIDDRMATSSSTRAIHWTDDERIWILNPSAMTLSTIPWTGGEITRFVDLPHSCAHEGGVSMTVDAEYLVCSVVERESDVWVIENFDPEVAAEIREF